jgi:hypothetical protein
MESAPQSTIAHIAVIDLPQILILTPRLTPRERRAYKKKASPAQRAALNRRDHAKITCRAQRREGHKTSISSGICALSFSQES